MRHFRGQNVDRPPLKDLRPIIPLSGDSRPPLSVSSGLWFRTDLDKSYFDSFVNDAIPKMTCPANHRLWTHVLLRACHDEPWVVDSVIAIAALRFSTRMDQQRTNCPDRHQQVAFERYGQAVRAMKLALTNEERHLRKALIGCILVFIFENYQGHHKLAMLHVHSGYQMLRRWLESKSYGTPVYQAIDPRYNSSVVEQDLINLFTRLHSHTITTVRKDFPSSSLLSDQEMLEGDAILSNMPAKFSDIEEAKRYMFLILRRAMIFFAVADEIVSAASARRSSQTSESTHASEDETSPANFDPAAMAHSPFQTSPVPNTIIAGHAKHSLEFTRGQQAFDHLYTLRKPPSPMMVAHIQLAFDYARIHLNSLIVTEECAFDKHIHDYGNLLLNAKQRLKVTPSSVNELNPFALEFGFLPPLYLVCKFCRDGQVRRDAISVMRQAPRREGAFDRELLIRISIWVMEIEEESMVGGHIPELARIRVIGVDVNMETKSARVRAVKRTDLSGGFVTLRTIINLEE